MWAGPFPSRASPSHRSPDKRWRKGASLCPLPFLANSSTPLRLLLHLLHLLPPFCDNQSQFLQASSVDERPRAPKESSRPSTLGWDCGRTHCWTTQTHLGDAGSNEDTGGLLWAPRLPSLQPTLCRVLCSLSLIPLVTLGPQPCSFPSGKAGDLHRRQDSTHLSLPLNSSPALLVVQIKGRPGWT